jgi:hypothetical protein
METAFPDALVTDWESLVEHRQVLADRLPGHVQPGTQFPQALPVPGVQAMLAWMGSAG